MAGKRELSFVGTQVSIGNLDNMHSTGVDALILDIERVLCADGSLKSNGHCLKYEN
jgi:hypothetical protein